MSELQAAENVASANSDGGPVKAEIVSSRAIRVELCSLQAHRRGRPAHNRTQRVSRSGLVPLAASYNVSLSQSNMVDPLFTSR